MSAKKNSSRPARIATKAGIVEHLRKQILRGKLAPGQRMPTRRQLMQRFGTTNLTLQRAFDVLGEQGFISTDGGRGTFVAQHLPHTSRYALVFPDHATSDWSHFYQALRTVALQIETPNNCPGSRKVALFYDVDFHCRSTDSQRLLHEMETHQLAGVVFSFNPEFIDNTPLMQVLDVPMVAVMDQANHYGIPSVKIDYHSFFGQALNTLAGRGRRRVAAINARGLSPKFASRFFRDALHRGFETQPHWWLPVHLDAPETARFYLQLLMSQNSKTRPDALIVSDDKFLDETLEGLKQMKLRVPQDVEVVAHGNFPLALPTPPAVHRLGYSAQQVLSTCLDLIDRQRAEEVVPSLTAVNAVFEDRFFERELDVSSSLPARHIS